MKTAGRGNIHIRRNLDESTDPYLSSFRRREIAACTECHALYQRRHWFFDEDAYAREAEKATTRQVVCPACQKIRDHYAEGRVLLKASPFLNTHKDEIVNLIHAEETRAKGFNPLERIIAITEADEALVVTTTNEKLAQRIGRVLKHAYQGQTTYQWSEPRFLSVIWHRQ